MGIADRSGSEPNDALLLRIDNVLVEIRAEVQRSMLIGNSESVFHELPQVRQFPHFQAFLDSDLANH